MSNNAAACPGGGEIGRAQALQARAAGLEPTVDMNPVLLKPQSDRTSQVVVHGRAVSTLAGADYLARRDRLLAPVLESFERLAGAFDLVLVEGAGSAAETNLRERDIANMGFARRAGVPVCLLADIDRGGVIASVVGTRAVLDRADAAMITSFAINKLRGDPALFDDGVREIERHTGWPCRGVIPWLEPARRLPPEDAVVLDDRTGPPAAGPAGGRIRIVAPRLSRIANFDDADPLRMEPGVDFAFIAPGTALPRDADVVVLPGTKSTLGDLAFLRAQGWDHDVIAHARAGGRVLGLCGGYQMLGRRVRDPDGVDGPAGEAPGLGLLDVETVMGGGEVGAAGGRHLRAERGPALRVRDPHGHHHRPGHRATLRAPPGRPGRRGERGRPDRGLLRARAVRRRRVPLPVARRRARRLVLGVRLRPRHRAGPRRPRGRARSGPRRRRHAGRWLTPAHVLSVRIRGVPSFAPGRTPFCDGVTPTRQPVPTMGRQSAGQVCRHRGVTPPHVEVPCEASFPPFHVRMALGHGGRFAYAGTSRRLG